MQPLHSCFWHLRLHEWLFNFERQEFLQGAVPAFCVHVHCVSLMCIEQVVVVKVVVLAVVGVLVVLVAASIHAEWRSGYNLGE